MGLKDSIKNVRGVLMETESIHERELNLFRTLDVDKVKEKLSLEKRGIEEGKKELPDENDENLDESEQAIIDLVQSEFDSNQKLFEQYSETYKSRYNRLSNTSDYSKIEIDARNAIADFRKRKVEGRTQLHIEEQNLIESSQERRHFKKRHNLQHRTAYYPELSRKVFGWGLIMVLFLVESVANGNLLAEGSDLGFYGGIAQAITIAGLNIGIALVTGYVGLRQLWHRNLVLKLLGLVWLFGWVAITLTFNLLIAHYRELVSYESVALDVRITDPGIPQHIIEAFLQNTFGLNDTLSWVLFGIGVLFALIALLESLSMDDKYPFYGKLERKYQSLRSKYADMRSTLINELEDSKSEAIEDITLAIDMIHKNSKERQAIQTNWAALKQEHLSSLKTLSDKRDQLLRIYRSANREARTTNVPTRFHQGIEKIEEKGRIIPPVWATVDTDIHSETLRKTIQDFFEEFESAIEEYPPLDVVTGNSKNNGSTQNS